MGAPLCLGRQRRCALDAPRTTRYSAHLEMPPGRIEVRAGTTEAWALVRSLASLLGGPGGPPGEGAPADASVDSPPGTATWRVRLVVQRRIVHEGLVLACPVGADIEAHAGSGRTEFEDAIVVAVALALPPILVTGEHREGLLE